MKEIQLRNLAVSGVFIMLFVIGLSYLIDMFPYDGTGAYDYAASGEAQAGNVQHGDYVYKRENKNNADHPAGTDVNNTDSGDSADAADSGEEIPDIMDARITIPKLSEESSIEFEDIYINRQIRITVNNSIQGAYGKDMVTCGNNSINNVRIRDILPEGQEGAVKTVITIELDGVYEYSVYEENNLYVIDMLDIHSVYDKVIVIDAGHGGGDVGCGSRDSNHYEKDITLSVVESLKEKLDATDIKVYYTRLKDETVYLRPRVSLANDVKADMFISIHCNYYDRYWLYEVNGAEALYSSKNREMKALNIKLANIMIDKYTEEVAVRKRGIINRKSELYILKKSHVPSTILEMGFMSDKNDLKYLVNSKKREKIVSGIYNGIVEAYRSIYGKTVSGL